MTRVRTLLGAAFVVGGLLAIGPASLPAQDEPEGIIRITDCIKNAPAACGTDGACPSLAGGCPSAGYGCPPGIAGSCPPGGYGHCGYGCGQGGCCRCTGHLCKIVRLLDPNGPGTVSPDHGWAPPGKLTLWRRPVAYNTFFPNAWTGQPSVGAEGFRARQVYTPTDTTQLGYYYQHVPHWQPNAAMHPGTPNPLQWHQPLAGGMCGVTGAGYVVNAGPACPTDAAQPAPAEELSAPEEPVPAPPPPEEPAGPSAADLQKPSDAPSLLPTPGHQTVGG